MATKLRRETVAILEDISHYNLITHTKLLGQSLLKAGYRPDQPRLPAGVHGGGQWTGEAGSSPRISKEPGDYTGINSPNASDGVGVMEYDDGDIPDGGGDTLPEEGGIGEEPAYEDMTSPETWANPDIIEFEDHYFKHYKDFGDISPEEYGTQANELYQRGLQENLPTVETSQGYSKVYDPQTNSFGVYDPDGKTATFYKPTSPNYYPREVEKIVGEGGRVVNPLNLPAGPENPGQYGTRTPAPPLYGGSGGGSGGIAQKPALGPMEE